MVHHLFELFHDDPHVYQECRRFWERLTADISRSIGSDTDWRPWIPRTYANGTPMQVDDVAIWDGRSGQLDRAYRILQGQAEEDDVEIAAWIKSYEEEYEEFPRHELFISLSLSEESAKIAAALLRMWMTPETTPTSMQAFIAETIPPLPAADP